MDKIEKEIRDFINANYPNDYCTYLDNWIDARNGDILQVFIEFLESYNQVEYSSAEEKDLINKYRCLDDANKASVLELVDTRFNEILSKRKHHKRKEFK